MTVTEAASITLILSKHYNLLIQQRPIYSLLSYSSNDSRIELINKLKVSSPFSNTPVRLTLIILTGENITLKLYILLKTHLIEHTLKFSFFLLSSAHEEGLPKSLRGSKEKGIVTSTSVNRDTLYKDVTSMETIVLKNDLYELHYKYVIRFQETKKKAFSNLILCKE